MAKIIPIRDLRKGAEISEFVRTSGEPIFITRNGYGDMVIMSMSAYEKAFAEKAIYDAIMESEEQVNNGVAPISPEELFAELRSIYVKE